MMLRLVALAVLFGGSVVIGATSGAPSSTTGEPSLKKLMEIEDKDRNIASGIGTRIERYENNGNVKISYLLGVWDKDTWASPLDSLKQHILPKLNKQSGEIRDELQKLSRMVKLAVKKTRESLEEGKDGIAFEVGGDEQPFLSFLNTKLSFYTYEVPNMEHTVLVAKKIVQLVYDKKKNELRNQTEESKGDQEFEEELENALADYKIHLKDIIEKKDEVDRITMDGNGEILERGASGGSDKTKGVVYGIINEFKDRVMAGRATLTWGKDKPNLVMISRCELDEALKGTSGNLGPPSGPPSPPAGGGAGHGTSPPVGGGTTSHGTSPPAGGGTGGGGPPPDTQTGTKTKSGQKKSSKGVPLWLKVSGGAAVALIIAAAGIAVYRKRIAAGSSE